MSFGSAAPQPAEEGVDVIVVSYNQRRRLLACLASVLAHRPSAHLIVVDNASSDGSPAAVREHCPQASLIEMDSNVGFAAAVNRGARAGGAPRILLLNNDARLRAGALDHLQAAMQPGTVGAAGPRLLGEDGHIELSTGRTLSPWNEAGFKLLASLYRDGRGPLAGIVARRYAVTRETRSLSGACMLLDRDAFDEIGGFDERFFLYAEDVDYCVRLRQAGWTLAYVGAAVVEHDRGASSAGEPIAAALHYRRSQMAFYRKHRSALAALALRLYLALRFAARCVVGRGEERELAAALLRWTLRESGR